MDYMNRQEWKIINSHGDALVFCKRDDDPDYISIEFRAPSVIRGLSVGAALGVCDYDFLNNGLPHRVHVDFARAVWDGLTQKEAWMEKSKVSVSYS
jgi:hypothetical protein